MNIDKQIRLAMSVVHTVMLLVTGVLISGCETGRLHLSEPFRVESLDPIKTARSTAPVKVQIVNFIVKVLESDAGNIDAESIRKNLELTVPNDLYTSLGERHVFSEVTRTARPEPSSVDYIVSGEYEFVSRNERGWGFTSGVNYIKGTTHLHLLDTKTNSIFFEKTYVEERQDKTGGEVTFLQQAHIAEITADIKRAIYEKMGIRL